MQKKIISFEILYISILVDNYLESGKQKDYKILVDFLSQQTFFDKKTFSTVRILLSEIVDFKPFVANLLLKDKKDFKEELIKLKKIVDLFITKYSESIQKKSICLKNLNLLCNYLHSDSNDLFNYLMELSLFLIKYIEDNGVNIVTNNLYYYLMEFLDMFKKSKKIIVDSELIKDKFKLYFDILNLKPQTIAFLNNEENIKIIQDFLPNEVLTACFKALGIKNELVFYNNFFILEMHKKYFSNKKYHPLLSHELGHLLDVEVFNFNNTLVNIFYEKYGTNINVGILQRWLNELIADYIAFRIEGENFTSAFLDFSDESYNEFYPPRWLRLGFLEGGQLTGNAENLYGSFKAAGDIIVDNSNTIKQLLSIVTNK